MTPSVKMIIFLYLYYLKPLCMGGGVNLKNVISLPMVKFVFTYLHHRWLQGWSNEVVSSRNWRILLNTVEFITNSYIGFFLVLFILLLNVLGVEFYRNFTGFQMVNFLPIVTRVALVWSKLVVSGHIWSIFSSFSLIF